MVLNSDVSTNLVHNKSVLSMKFDSSVHRAGTDCGVSGCGWVGVCVCVSVLVCVGGCGCV